jgi:predicted Fe-S protein YdhL (DUF1289 family)
MPVESPCNKICTLDARGTYCIGCGRTLDEIARWTGMSDEERARVVNRIREQKARQTV